MMPSRGSGSERRLVAVEACAAHCRRRPQHGPWAICPLSHEIRFGFRFALLIRQEMADVEHRQDSIDSLQLR
ncbi:unnamed protein product [Urochloa humidicola]